MWCQEFYLKLHISTRINVLNPCHSGNRGILKKINIFYFKTIHIICKSILELNLEKHNFRFKVLQWVSNFSWKIEKLMHYSRFVPIVYYSYEHKHDRYKPQFLTSKLPFFPPNLKQPSLRWPGSYPTKIKGISMNCILSESCLTRIPTVRLYLFH